MIEVAGEKIYYVDFHCQWMHKSLASIFLAGLSYQGFDAGVMVVPATFGEIESCVRASGVNFLAIPGREYTYNWGHVISVGYSGDIAEGQTDFRHTLKELREKAGMVVFAHPLHAPTRSVLWDSGLTDGLIDEGLFGAIELVNSYNLQRDLELIRWYDGKLAQGDTIPITGGCDTHYLQSDKRPDTVYSPSFPPCGLTPEDSDIDGQGGVRTLVMAERCTEEAIIEAVRESRTIVESQGKLFGPRALVEKLLKAGYWEAVEDDMRKRRALSLNSGNKLISGTKEACRIEIQCPVRQGCLTFNGRTELFSGNSASITVPEIGDEIDAAWIPLSVGDRSNKAELVSAVKVVQPIDIDLYGCRKADANEAYITCKLKNNTGGPLSGKITYYDGDKLREIGFGKVDAQAELVKSLPLSIKRYPNVSGETEITIDLADGGRRTIKRELTFVGCRYAVNPDRLNWDKAEMICFNRPEQVGIGNWDGIDDLSADIKLLWSEKGLHLLADVKDNIHVQPFHGGELYQGDCIQLGIDAFGARSEASTSTYEFLMGLSDAGPELYCNTVPTREAGTEYNLPNTFLPQDCVKVNKTDRGLVYESLIPWDWLKPLRPEINNTFGLFILLFDNDGEQYEVNSGCKSIMIWPGKRLLGWKAGTRHWAAITFLK